MSQFIIPEFVRCPHCGAPLERDGGSLFCKGERRHTYDIAKEGYVNLLPPGRAKNSHTGDGADMIKAREVFLAGGGYDRYSREAAELAAEVLMESDQPKVPLHQGGTVVGESETTAEAGRSMPAVLTDDIVESDQPKVPLHQGGTVVGGFETTTEAGRRLKNPPDVSEKSSGLPSCDEPETTTEAGRSMPAGAPRSRKCLCTEASPSCDEAESTTEAGRSMPAVLTDAGCGEGRHTVNMAAALSRVLGVPVTAVGFDASKFGVKAAAKRYVRSSANTPEGVNAAFYTANIFSLPVADGCADVFTSLFAPLPEDEVRRVLRTGGVLMICAAGADHLGEMRSVLYETPIPSGGGAAVPDGFTTVREKIIEYTLELGSNEEIMSLFIMTPFYHNAPPAGRAKLEAMTSMTVTVQVKCTIATKD